MRSRCWLLETLSRWDSEWNPSHLLLNPVPSFTCIIPISVAVICGFFLLGVSLGLSPSYRNSRPLLQDDFILTSHIINNAMHRYNAFLKFCRLGLHLSFWGSTVESITLFFPCGGSQQLFLFLCSFTVPCWPFPLFQHLLNLTVLNVFLVLPRLCIAFLIKPR